MAPATLAPTLFRGNQTDEWGHPFVGDSCRVKCRGCGRVHLPGQAAIVDAICCQVCPPVLARRAKGRHLLSAAERAAFDAMSPASAPYMRAYDERNGLGVLN